MTAEGGPFDTLRRVVDGHGDRGARGASDLVYRGVRDAILKGELPAGTVLAEEELARALGTSRTPIRTALRALEAERLLELGARRQLVVRSIAPNERREVLLLRRALEESAVREACRAMPVECVDELQLILIRQRRAAAEGNVDAFLDEDDRFHLLIARGGQLPLHEQFLSQVRAISRLMGLGALTAERRLDEVIAEHEAIVVALEAHDPAGAARAMEAHLAQTHDVLSSLGLAGD